VYELKKTRFAVEHAVNLSEQDDAEVEIISKHHLKLAELHHKDVDPYQTWLVIWTTVPYSHRKAGYQFHHSDTVSTLYIHRNIKFQQYTLHTKDGVFASVPFQRPSEQVLETYTRAKNKSVKQTEKSIMTTTGELVKLDVNDSYKRIKNFLDAHYGEKKNVLNYIFHSSELDYVVLDEESYQEIFVDKKQSILFSCIRESPRQNAKRKLEGEDSGQPRKKTKEA
jgi:hypothetical protein